VLEAAALVSTRRLLRKEEKLKEEFLARTGTDA
jgi:hypothetical protein